MKNFIALTRLNRPIGILLLLFPTLIALLLSTGEEIPNFKTLIIFTIGVIVMRSAGCVINDIADRKIDNHVERTKDRPLANGSMSLITAIVYLVLLLSVALVLFFFLQFQTQVLAIIALVLAMTYPFSKRYIPIPQFVLSLAFSMPILLVYAEVDKLWTLTPWLLFVANLCWTIAYDTQYALTDKEDDLKLNIYSTAIYFGKQVLVYISIFQVAFLALMYYVGIINNLNYYYDTLVIFCIAFFIYQNWNIHKDEKKGFTMFLNNQYVGFFLALAILIGKSTIAS